MQSSQYRAVSALAVPVLLLLWLACAFAQVQREQLYQAYMNKDFSRLRTLLGQVPPAQAHMPEVSFYQALFNENADSAAQIYQDVFERANAQVKLLSAQKLYEYYYAKGFYVTAEKYQKYMTEHGPEKGTVQVLANPASTSPPEKVYYIQVGAFGIKENAQQRRMFLKTQDVPSILVERQVDGRILYCVWVKGKTDFEQTLQMANRLKGKFDLEYQIMKK